MVYEIENKKYNVIIERKNNKNTYIRFKKDMNIYVYTNYFVTKKQIKNLLDTNKISLKEMIDNITNIKNKDENFYYLGKKYDIIFMKVDKVTIIGNNLYTTDLNMLNKWLKSQVLEIFKTRLDIIYNIFEEEIPYPNLKIRKMTSRWGVCNRKNNNVTLNFDLIKYEVEKIDYVIIHELSHFIHFNHSNSFWNLVGKYCPNYKKIRKELRG